LGEVSEEWEDRVSRRNNRKVEVIYNKSLESLFITFTQSKSIKKEEVDDEIGILKYDKRGTIHIEIRNFKKYIRQHTEEWSKIKSPAVASIVTPSYNKGI
jgi:uncharacterized protein YuzE